VTRFIAHLRVSARRQGAPGLGIEKGKREAITRHFVGHGGAVTAEFVEGGRKDAGSRLTVRRRHRAALLVAKVVEPAPVARAIQQGPT
jgi:hypothetical protein